MHNSDGFGDKSTRNIAQYGHYNNDIGIEKGIYGVTTTIKRCSMNVPASDVILDTEVSMTVSEPTRQPASTRRPISDVAKMEQELSRYNKIGLALTAGLDLVGDCVSLNPSQSRRRAMRYR
jgi:hypothetical protein